MHRHGSASQLREVDQTSGADLEYLDFACCYAGLLGVFRRYNGSRSETQPSNPEIEKIKNESTSAPAVLPVCIEDHVRSSRNLCTLTHD